MGRGGEVLGVAKRRRRIRPVGIYLQGGAPKIANSVQNSNFTRTYGRYIYT